MNTRKGKSPSATRKRLPAGGRGSRRAETARDGGPLWDNREEGTDAYDRSSRTAS